MEAVGRQLHVASGSLALRLLCPGPGTSARFAWKVSGPTPYPQPSLLTSELHHLGDAASASDATHTVAILQPPRREHVQGADSAKPVQELLVAARLAKTILQSHPGAAVRLRLTNARKGVFSWPWARSPHWRIFRSTHKRSAYSIRSDMQLRLSTAHRELRKLAQNSYSNNWK